MVQFYKFAYILISFYLRSLYAQCEVDYRSGRPNKGPFGTCTITWKNVDNNDVNPYPLKIKYINNPPYIWEGTDGQATGILKDMFDNFYKWICRGNGPIRYEKSGATDSDTLLQNCKDNNNCHMSIPSVTSTLASKYSGVPVGNMHLTPAISLFTFPIDTNARIMESLLGTMENVWPLFVVAMQVAFLAGVVVWLLERWQNEEDFPKPFVYGTYEAFWWSYISMTTVGYGDIAPLSVCARMFAVFWILIGISMIGLITSMLSSALSEATANDPLTITGHKIGCIDITPHAKATILNYGGTPVCTKSIIELEKMAAHGQIHGIAMDSLQLQYYAQSRLSKLDGDLYIYQEDFETSTLYSVGFYAIQNGINSNTDPQNFANCLKDFVAYNGEEQKTVEFSFREKYLPLLDTTFTDKSSSLGGVAVLDPENPAVHKLLWIMTIVVMIVILIGVAFDVFIIMRRKHLRSNKGYEETEMEKQNNFVSREDQKIAEAIERTMSSADEKLEATQKSIRNEIQELSREIRTEMKKTHLFQNYQPSIIESRYPPSKFGGSSINDFNQAKGGGGGGSAINNYNQARNMYQAPNTKYNNLGYQY